MVDQEIMDARKTVIDAIDGTHPDWVLRRIVIDKRTKSKPTISSRYIKFLSKNIYMSAVFATIAVLGYLFSSQIIVPIIVIIGWLLIPIDEVINGSKCEDGTDTDTESDADPNRDHGPVCIPDDTEASGWKCIP